MITRGVLIWGWRTILYVLAAVTVVVLFFYPSSSWYGIILFTTVILYLLYVVFRFFLAPPAVKYPPEMTASFLQLGWPVELVMEHRVKVPIHLFTEISKLASQELKLLYQIQLPTQTGPGQIVIAHVVTPTESGSVLARPAHHASPVSMVLLTRPKAIIGWIRVQPTQLLENMLGKDIDLESVEFNKLFDIRGSDKRQVWQSLGPDLMSWYQGLPRGCWLHLEDNQAVLVFTRYLTSEDLKTLPTSIQQLRRMIERSGIDYQPTTETP